MKIFTQEKDIKVYCLTAQSFPEGVLEAHQKLHGLVPYNKERKYFGISRPENGKIVYRSAAEELTKGELSKHGLEEFVIPKGKYRSVTIKNFMQNIPAIGEAFEELISQPDIDPNGYCIEWYLSEEEVMCMVKLK